MNSHPKTTAALTAGVLALTAAVTFTLTTGADPAARLTPPTTGRADATGPRVEHVDAWASPEGSTRARPSTVLAAADAADADGTVRVVAVLDADGRPDVVVEKVDGAADAAETIADLQENPDVVAISVDTRVTASGEDPARGRQWGLGAVDADAAWAHASGAGALVAVVDTGVHAAHEDLAGQVVSGVEFLAGNGSATPGDGRSDPVGHGTHVAGIVAAVKGNGLGVTGLAPTATILPIRALDADGAGWNSDIAAGIIYAVDHGADVVNLSLGGPARDSATETAVQYALAHDVVVVAAAGNNRQRGNQTTYPAAYPGVIAVASVELNGSSSTFSNTGAYVDVAAPGGVIYSTHPDGYTLMSGTSMATPHVAAIAALAVDATNGKLDAERFTAILARTATDRGAAGVDPVYGAGIVNAYKTTCTYLLCLPEAPEDPTDPDPTGDPEDPTGPDPTDPGVPDVVAQPSRVSFLDGGGGVYAGTLRTVTVKVTNPFSGDPLPGTTVVITGDRRGGRTVKQRLVTDERGRASLTVRIRRTTRFTAEVVASGQTEAARATYPITWRAVPRVSVGYSGTSATATLARPAGHRILFQRASGARWVTARRGTPDRSGSVAVTGLARGIWRVKVTAAAGQVPAITGTWVVRSPRAAAGP